MSKINDGGPAFPTHGDQLSNATYGMTLRDYFAGQALVGSLTAGESTDPKVIAKFAFEYADAMIAERVKNESSN